MRWRRLVPVLLLALGTTMSTPVPARGAETFPHVFAAVDRGVGPDPFTDAHVGVVLYGAAGGRELIDPTGSGDRISWRPDGGGFVYRGNEGISIYDLASQSSRTLYDGPGFEDNPVVSPQGDLVVYSNNDEVRVVGIDGRGDRPLYAPATLYTHQPWSSDGTRLVVTGTLRNRRTDIRIVDVRTGAATEFTPPDDAHVGAVWSPTADVIAIPSRVDGVILLSPDGSVVGRLPGRRPGLLTWSPDGTRLAGGAFVGDSITSAGVHVWDTRGGQAQELFAGGGAGVLNEHVSSWSSDGAYIAFYRVLKTENDKVATVDVATREVRFHGPGTVPALQPAPPSRAVGGAANIAGTGVWVAYEDGEVQEVGSASDHGDASAIRLNAPVVGIARTASGGGHWLLARDGGVFSHGDAVFRGSTGNTRLNRPIVSLASDPKGRGYWFVAADGGVFAFGSPFHGSAANIRLAQPIVGMAPTRTGSGYFLVARDGGVFSYGDAVFRGSTGAMTLNRPIVGIAADPDGDGYWFVASDGGIFSFNATFHGSGVGSVAAGDSVVGMVAHPAGGYWLVTAKGAVLAYGAAGSMSRSK